MVKKNDLVFIIGAIILAAVVTVPSATLAHAETDPFGIEEIYETDSGQH